MLINPWCLMGTYCVDIHTKLCIFSRNVSLILCFASLFANASSSTVVSVNIELVAVSFWRQGWGHTLSHCLSPFALCGLLFKILSGWIRIFFLFFRLVCTLSCIWICWVHFSDSYPLLVALYFWLPYFGRDVYCICIYIFWLHQVYLLVDVYLLFLLTFYS